MSDHENQLSDQELANLAIDPDVLKKSWRQNNLLTLSTRSHAMKTLMRRSKLRGIVMPVSNG